MENRIKKPRSLNRLLGGYLVRTLLCCAAVLLASLAALLLLVTGGVLLPAYTMSGLVMEVAAAQEGAPTLEADTLPGTLCRWAWLAQPGSDEVLATNMDAWHLENALASLRGRRGHWGYTQFYKSVAYQDGTALLLQFDYAVHYADPAWDARLPDAQASHVLLTLLLLALTVAANTRRTAKALSAEAAKLTAASEKIAAGQLPPPARAAVREFDGALAAMQTLGRTMTDSLQKQWAMEQQRTEQVAALAHDLKTPLAVMQGNAELLAEEPLTDAQQAQVQAILRGAQRAQGCLAALRAAGAAPAPRETVEAASFAAEIAATGQALCRPAGVNFALQSDLQGSLHIQKAALTRALENLLDNAVRYTPPGGTVTLACTRQGGEVRFTVMDTGPGFTPEARRRAGQFLYTEDAARPADGHQGLGLYLARTAAQAHGGRLLVESPPAGAAVTLTVAGA